MSLVTIPISATGPRHDIQIELSGRDWRLELNFNARGETWELSIYNSAGALVAAGQPLPGDAPLMRLLDSPELPPGVFWVVDEAGPGRDPNRQTLGNGISLMYKEIG